MRFILAALLVSLAFAVELPGSHCREGPIQQNVLTWESPKYGEHSQTAVADASVFDAGQQALLVVGHGVSHYTPLWYINAFRVTDNSLLWNKYFPQNVPGLGLVTPKDIVLDTDGSGFYIFGDDISMKFSPTGVSIWNDTAATDSCQSNKVRQNAAIAAGGNSIWVTGVCNQDTKTWFLDQINKNTGQVIASRAWYLPFLFPDRPPQVPCQASVAVDLNGDYATVIHDPLNGQGLVWRYVGGNARCHFNFSFNSDADIPAESVIFFDNNNDFYLLNNGYLIKYNGPSCSMMWRNLVFNPDLDTVLEWGGGYDTVNNTIWVSYNTIAPSRDGKTLVAKFRPSDGAFQEQTQVIVFVDNVVSSMRSTEVSIDSRTQMLYLTGYADQTSAPFTRAAAWVSLNISEDAVQWCASCYRGWYGTNCKNQCLDCGHGICYDGLIGDGTCDCEALTFGPRCQACPCSFTDGTCRSGPTGDGTCSECSLATSFGPYCNNTCACEASRCTAGITGDGTCKATHESITSGFVVLVAFLVTGGLISSLFGVYSWVQIRNPRHEFSDSVAPSSAPSSSSSSSSSSAAPSASSSGYQTVGSKPEEL